MRGSVEAKAAASSVAAIHTRLRHFSTSGLCASSHQPSSVSGSSSTMLAKPSNCMARSEKMAPGKPSRLWIGFCVAWLSEGSCTDQVASAMAPSSPSVSRARPAASLKRRRTMSRKCSVRKATTSRLAGCSHFPIRARRRGDAAPPPWSPCPAPWRRGYSPMLGLPPSACSRAELACRAPRARRLRHRRLVTISLPPYCLAIAEPEENPPAGRV